MKALIRSICTVAVAFLMSKNKNCVSLRILLFADGAGSSLLLTFRVFRSSGRDADKTRSAFNSFDVVLWSLHFVFFFSCCSSMNKLRQENCDSRTMQSIHGANHSVECIESHVY